MAGTAGVLLVSAVPRAEGGGCGSSEDPVAMGFSMEFGGLPGVSGSLCGSSEVRARA